MIHHFFAKQKDPKEPIVDYWQGWQVVDRTFEDDIEVDIEEIRSLLDEGVAPVDVPGRLGE